MTGYLSELEFVGLEDFRMQAGYLSEPRFVGLEDFRMHHGQWLNWIAA